MRNRILALVIVLLGLPAVLRAADGPPVPLTYNPAIYTAVSFQTTRALTTTGVVYLRSIFGNLPVTINAIGSTSTPGLTLQNQTASTVGTTAQFAPSFINCGTAWKSNATAVSETDCIRAELRPVTGTTATTFNYTFSKSMAGAAYADLIQLNSSGEIYGSEGVTSTIQNVLRGGVGSWTNGGNAWVLKAGNLVTNNPNFKIARSDGTDIFGADLAAIYVAGKVQLGNALTNGDTYLGRSAAGIVEVSNGVAGTQRDILARHYFAGGTVPSVANTSANSCGTTTATIVGGDEGFRITVGATSGTSCTVTFGTAGTNAPACTAINETTANIVRAQPTTSTVVIVGTFVAGDKIAGTCRFF